MLSRLVGLFIFLGVQLFAVSEVQAQTTLPGYTTWNDYVRSIAGCNGDNVICDTFADGETIYLIGYGECNWDGNTCVSVKKNYSRFSNDPYGLVSIYASYMNPYYERINNYELTSSVVPGALTSSGLSFEVYFSSSSGTHSAGGGSASTYYVPPCPGYVSGPGCPNTTGDNQLDRTSRNDGPCEICSKWGNPFDVRSGAKVETVVDLDFPLVIKRLYSSKARFPGMFGLNWRSNFDKKVKIYGSATTINSLLFITPEEDQVLFNSGDGAAFSPVYSDNFQYKVAVLSSTIELYKPNSGKEVYDKTTGKILYEVYKGKTLTYQYASNGTLYRVVDSTGKYLQFYFSGYADVVEQITASNGDTLSYSYDGGNVSTVRLNDITQITYQYAGVLMTGKFNGSGVQYASFTYDDKSRGIENKWVTSDGHEIKKYTFSYNTSSTTVTQGNGFARTYSVSNINFQNKIASVNWNGYSEQNSFDSNGNVSQNQDFNGTYTSYVYDNAERIVGYSRSGKQVSLTWDTTNNLVTSISETSANGTRTASLIYDGNNNVVTKTVSGSGGTFTWNYSWTSDGRLLSESAPDGLVTTYTYNAIDNSNVSGLLASVTNNAGQSMVINAYDVRGNPTSITVNGVVKTMSYDYKGRILSESVGGVTNLYTYDSEGNMLTVTLATGYQMSMAYDSAGRLLSIQDNMGGSASFGIDDYTNEVLNTSVVQGNALVRARNKVIDALGRTTRSWNATSRTLRTASYYSRFSTPNSTQDANGYQYSYGFNSNDDITSYSGGGDSSMQTYDVDSNLSSVTANNQQTTMNYDDFGRMVQLNSPDTGTHSYTYSTATRTVTHTDAKGTVHTSVSDLNGNPVSITHAGSGSSQSESYSYDVSGALIGFSDSSGSTSYTRNALEEITSKTQNIGGKSFTVSATYDGAGQKTSETYPSGLVVSYGYTNGFLTSISAGGTAVVSNVAYNSILKEPVSWSLGGNQVSVNKDADGLLTGFSDSGAFNQAIATDNEGHVVSMNDNMSSDSFAVSLTANYSLQSGTINSKTLNYRFGGNGNLYIQQDGLTSYSFNPSPYHNKVSDMTNNVTYVNSYYQYDANGNTTVDAKGNYGYDLKNNMISSTRTVGGASHTGTYSFNALEQRVVKTVSGQSRYFVYNNSNQLIGEYDSSGNAIAEYVYFGLRPVAVKNGSSINIVHTDYLGTPRVVTSGGSVVWQWKNDNPYGSNQATGSIEFNLRFAGQYYDYESVLHYNIHRSYDPDIGRYMQSDPIGLGGGFNTYNYVNKNPLDAVDPLGLEAYSATTNSILTEAVNNPLSSPASSLALGGHSLIDEGEPKFNIEHDSQLFNQMKLKNPQLNMFKVSKNWSLSADQLAQLLKSTFNLKKYDKIYLQSCRLGKLADDEGVIYAQRLSNLLGMPVVAYKEYLWASKPIGGSEKATYTGYYTNWLYNQGAFGRSISSASFHSSANAKEVEVTFYPR
jgi:RHS repeat-associated protein